MMLPILGLSAGSAQEPLRVQWADGSPCGILGKVDELIARGQALKAEEAHKEELRNQGITVLDDYRHDHDPTTPPYPDGA